MFGILGALASSLISGGLGYFSAREQRKEQKRTIEEQRRIKRQEQMDAYKRANDNVYSQTGFSPSSSSSLLGSSLLGGGFNTKLGA